MRGRGCVAGRACMAREGACVAGSVHGRECVWKERRPLQRTVRILLECILVFHVCRFLFDPFRSLDVNWPLM